MFPAKQKKINTRLKQLSKDEKKTLLARLNTIKENQHKLQEDIRTIEAQHFQILQLIGKIILPQHVEDEEKILLARLNAIEEKQLKLQESLRTIEAQQRQILHLIGLINQLKRVKEGLTTDGQQLLPAYQLQQQVQPPATQKACPVSDNAEEVMIRSWLNLDSDDESPTRSQITKLPN